MAALIVAAVAGCGPSSSPNTDAGGSAGANGGGGGSGGNGAVGGSAGGASGDVFTWRESGTLHTATIVGALRLKNTATATETMEIIGGDAAGTAVTLGVFTPAPSLTPGSFACGDIPGTVPAAMMSYTNNDSSQMETCTIVLSTIGDTTGSRTTGTFSGTVPLRSGGSATITDGVFDVRLSVDSL